MIVRRLNENGILEFREELNRLRNGFIATTPLPWLESDSLTEPVGGELAVPKSGYSSRLDLARAVIQAVGAETIDRNMNDTGLWAWLSAACLDSVCPQDPSGRRNPGSDYRHIPSSSYTQFYRHLVRGPVRILRLHPNFSGIAEVVLYQSPDKPGDLVEQLSSRLEIITNSAVLATANKLYFDPMKKAAKQGTSSKSKAGRPRRFIDLLGQLELTYDLYAIEDKELRSLLPTEFQHWLT